jgi:cation diffusion facilitator family transporter
MSQRRKVAVARLSVVSNAVLVIGKLLIGLAIGSVSVLSEAIHSGVDLLAAAIALLAVRQSGRPGDQQHPYGHGKVENLSALVEGLLIFVAAGWIIVEAVEKLLHPGKLDAAWLGVAVMGGSSAINWFVSSRLFSVARETESAALEADGWHLRTDVYTSMGVMAGLGLVWLGEMLVAGVSLAWLDPVVAMVVACFIVRAAYRLSRDAVADLMDSTLPEHEVNIVHECLASGPAELLAYHDLRTRKAGSQRFIEVHLEVLHTLSLDEAHKIADDVEQRIQARLRSASVITHVDPVGDVTGAANASKARRLGYE